MLRLTNSQLVLALGLVLRSQQQVSAFTVPIRDTDEFKEVCSGMWGGSEAHIDVSFDASSSGQVALVLYEWSDVPYLGVDTPEGSVGGISRPKTYICTDSAIRQGLCTSSQSGAFITSLPEGTSLESTSIFTQALRFGSSGQNQDFNTHFDTLPNQDGQDGQDQQDQQDQPQEPPVDTYDPPEATDEQDQGTTYDEPKYIPPPSSPDPSADLDLDPEPESDAPEEQDGDEAGEDDSGWGWGWGWWKRSSVQTRQTGIGLLDGIGDAINGMTGEPIVPTAAQEDEDKEDDENTEWGQPVDVPDQSADDSNDIEEGGGDDGMGENQGQGEQADPGTTTDVVTYRGPISYPVRKTGYYCVGVVPVTLLNSRDTLPRQDATHAEYSGTVLFRNTFEGELPAVEYPKINFYLILSVVYFALGCAWTLLCVKHRNELLPMQYYISGTIVFLIIEMLANFAYYRYINKHGGGASSIAFLFVVSVLNAARNSLSFFLLLIVSMGLSVVTQSLGGVMNKIRILTGFHFVFGVLYSVGTVQVELDSAALIIVMVLIFPLALTLTAFLMWIIVSLNGTILHLRTQKQRYKLQKFQTLWRILIIAVIAVAAFFVVSSMSLSNRLDEDYAPNNWRFRWILLDGSLASIYLCVFAAITWLWRPTRDNVRFSMSQELAQDELEADAEDYELMENGERRGHNHQPLPTEDDDFDGDLDEDARSLKSAKVRGLGTKNGVGEENVVFQMGDDSDDEGERSGRGSPPEYQDDDGGSNSGARAKGDKDD